MKTAAPAKETSPASPAAPEAARVEHTPEITVRSDGCANVFGELAHRLWAYGRGDYPKTAAAENRFFVLQLTEPERGDRWTMVAAQSTREGAMRYMDASGRVLVSIEPVHTETPWTISTYSHMTGFSLSGAFNSGYGCVAERWEENPTPGRAATIAANGKFILEAVNSHDALRAALLDCVENLESLAKAHDSDYARPDDSVITKARAALASGT